MQQSCPNISSQEWKDLVEVVGEKKAWVLFKQRGEIPKVMSIGTNTIDKLVSEYNLTYDADTGNILTSNPNIVKQINKDYANIKTSAIKFDVGYLVDVLVETPENYNQGEQFADNTKVVSSKDDATLRLDIAKELKTAGIENAGNQLFSTAVSQAEVLTSLAAKAKANIDYSSLSPKEAEYILYMLGEDSVTVKALKELYKSQFNNAIPSLAELGSLFYLYASNKNGMGESIAALVDNGIEKAYTEIKENLKKIDTSVLMGVINKYDALQQDNVSTAKLKTQQAIADDIIKTAKEMSSEKGLNAVTKEMDRYVGIDNFVYKHRPSDQAKTLFKGKRTQEEAKAANADPANALYRDTGTYVHALFEAFSYKHIDKFSNIELGYTEKTVELDQVLANTPDEIKKFSGVIEEAAIKILKRVNNTQISIDSTKTAKIFPEALLADKKTSLAGTEDLLVLYSDASASLYDYKSMHMKEIFDKEKGTKKYVSKALSGYKILSYEGQLVQYKQMLQDRYGVSKIREVRIIPVLVDFETVNSKLTGKIKNIDALDTYQKNNLINKEWLAEIPLTDEYTGNKDIDNVLRNIYARKKSIAERIRKSYGDPDKNMKLIEEQEVLQLAIVQLFNYGNSDALLETFSILTEKINSENFAEVTSLEELTQILRDISFFKDNLFTLRNVANIPGIKADISEVKQKLEENIKQIMPYIHSDYDKLIRIIEEKVERETNVSLSTPARELGMMDNVRYMGDIDHPLFTAAYKIYRKNMFEADRKTVELVEETKKLMEEVSNYTKASGSSIEDFFENFIDRSETKTGDVKELKLVRKFSKDFYISVEAASAAGDLTFLNKHFKLKANADEIYTKNKTNYRKILLSKFKEDSEIFKNKMALWEERNNFYENPNVITEQLGRIKYYEVVENPLFYSEAFKKINVNPIFLKVYNFLQSKNEEFNELVDEKITKDFIPKVQKDVIETMLTGNILQAGVDAWKSSMNSLKVSANDSLKMESDIGVHSIPLPYFDNFTYYDKKTGKYITSATNQSTNLLYNVMMFGNMVYTKKAMMDSSAVTEAAKTLIRDYKTIKTNSLGRPIVDTTTNNIEIVSGDKKAIELFTTLTNALIYGKTLQNKDFVDEVTNVSMSKLGQKALSVMSTKSLAGNWRSGIAGMLNGFVNSRIMSANGKYFNKKQWNEVTKEYADKEKLKWMGGVSQLFNFDDEQWLTREARKTAKLPLISRVLSADSLFLFQRSEKAAANHILFSMLKNYGIDPSNPNIVKRLVSLPNGTPSLETYFKLNKDIVEIDPALNNSAIADFGRKATWVIRTAKGSQSKVEFAAINATIYGRAVLQFRRWIQPTLAARFEGLRKNNEVDEYTLGRYVALFKSIIREDLTFKSIVVNSGKVLANIGTFGLFKYNNDENSLRKMYEQYKKNNIDKNISFEEYKLVMEEELKAGLTEFKILLALFGSRFLVSALASAFWPDDEEPEYNIPGIGVMFEIVDRLWLDLTFYLSPDSAAALLKSPIPIMGLIKDLSDVFSEIYDETGDAIFGEDKLSKTGKSLDKKNVWSEVEDLVPLINQTEAFVEALGKTVDKAEETAGEF